ncbi:hypothetical protein EG68_03622 [Paragonimus skrjabini miyazakii]|uniref:CUB domain-containing protein n=1 Tax=Paragonimus skrjabini miyazakii TaxID=59628 RepID=A0A8S9YW64_9TREM|nr:hypothetical protein EG68_03622 [Paragonimus skrjabini miyazakii]
MNTTGFLSVLVRLSSMFKISLDNSGWTRVIFYGMLICIQPRPAAVARDHPQQAHPSLFTSLQTTNLTARLRTNNDHRSPQSLRLEDVQRWKRRRRRDVPDVETPSDQDPRCAGFVQSAIINAPPTGSKDHPTSPMVSSLFGRTQKRSKEYRFQTPNYPDFFPHDMQCIKIISAPSKDHRILLNFRGLWELEKEPHCTCDFLEVRDGAFGFSPLLGRYCGRQLPNVGEGLQSSGPYMWLRFRSDSTLSHRGFQAVYRFFQVEQAAHQTLAVSACRSHFKQFLVLKAERLTRVRREHRFVHQTNT